MNNTIYCHNFDITQSIRDYVNQRCYLSLSRSSEHIRIVDISLSTINHNSSGRRETCCNIMIKFHNLEPILIKEIQSDLYFAIDGAFARARLAVIKKVDKKLRINKSSLPCELSIGMFNLRYSGG